MATEREIMRTISLPVNCFFYRWDEWNQLFNTTGLVTLSGVVNFNV
ncbi:hypothetical protein BTN50_1090 [Candidatus Enterovibrio altilux]|uniref:Uncharacterized protein n=1 Tax=Candidatus Enterovibrio altilux TaxID=1927128 RepID=A0A291B994_9GAMM|nr:hypothetical protein BTN50_1090 [Candidatus Enterovibrio luxaltus]